MNVDQILKELLPKDDQRTLVLNVFAESIEYVHKNGPRSWEVTCRPGLLNLNVGSPYVFRIERRQKDVIGLSLSTNKIRNKLPASVKRTAEFGSVPGGRFFYIPLVEFGNILPLVRDAHLDFIERAIRTSARKSRFARFHTKEAVEYIGRLTGKSLPQPGYVGDKEGSTSHSHQKSAPENLGDVWARLACRSRNVILYGPPGTGKTFQVLRLREKLKLADRMVFVTFHQSYCYEDFVEGLRPVADAEGKVHYEIKSGVFKLLCQQAQKDWEEKKGECDTYALVIDEINRGNISKIFGELITLIEPDKRLGGTNEIKVTLPYSGKNGDEFGVPPNLLIIGTMNTADRSIALLDVALRRRFTFVELMPDPKLLRESSKATGVSLDKLLIALNRKLEAHLDRDHQIGHSYFMDVKNIADLQFAWDYKIAPLLQEYFYGDGAKLLDVLGKDFVIEEKVAVADGGTMDSRVMYRLRTQMEENEFVESLKRLAGP